MPLIRHDPSKYKTVTEMATYLGVSRQSLYRAIGEGRLSAVVQRGNLKGWLIPIPEVERYEREELVPVAVAR